MSKESPRSIFTNLSMKKEREEKCHLQEGGDLPSTPMESAEKWFPVKKFIRGYARLTRIFSLDASAPRHAYLEVIRSDYLLGLLLQVICYVNFYELLVGFVFSFLCSALRRPRARAGRKGDFVYLANALPN